MQRGNDVRYYSYAMMKERIEATGSEFISCDQYDPQMDLKPEDAERISTELLVNMTLAMDDGLIGVLS